MVVVGREAVRVRECLAELGLEFVVNEAYEHGMSTSLRTGVAAALARWPDTAGLLIALGDQPLTDDRILPRLIAAFVSSTGARIVAPKYRGVRGNPVIFSRDVEGELAAITGDRGAREVIERDPARVHHVDFDTAPPVDVDTPGDLERLARELLHRER